MEEKLVSKYAQLSCRSICDDVCNKFPREIRDVVYSYIYRPFPIAVTSTCFDIEPGRTKRYVRGTAPHVWNVECVGEQMRMELCEQFYKSTTFILARHNLILLPKLRAIDRWNLGFPPTYFATNIHLKLAYGNLSTSQERCEEMTANETIDELQVYPEMLNGFRPGTKIKLSLYPRLQGSGPFDAKEWVVSKIIPTILPALDRLKTYGHLLHVVIGTYPAFEVKGYLSLDEWRSAFERVRVFRNALSNAQTLIGLV